MSARFPAAQLPARSTCNAILARHGLILKRRRRSQIGHPGNQAEVPIEPNQMWAADFKGEFKTRDGRYCYPLTVTDSYSRYLLGCQGLFSTRIDEAKPVFLGLFRKFGLPDRILTDNGSPFAARSLARLSQLSAWWVRLGIRPILIEPGKPQQNGRHERFHRTLKAGTANLRLEIGVPSSVGSIASGSNTTRNVPTRLWIWKHLPRSTHLHLVPCRPIHLTWTTRTTGRRGR